MFLVLLDDPIGGMYIDTATSPVVTLVIPSTVIVHKHPIL